MNYYFLSIGIILVLMVMTIFVIIPLAYSQQLTSNEVITPTNTGLKQEKQITTEEYINGLNICAEYDPAKQCDTVPQGIPIPIEKIPSSDSVSTVQQGDIYT